MKFVGFVKRNGARYGGTLAEFKGPFGDGFVVDAMHGLMRQHNLRRDGFPDPETDQAVADFQRCLDAQNWADAVRDFEAWLEKSAAE